MFVDLRKDDRKKTFFIFSYSLPKCQHDCKKNELLTFKTCTGPSSC